MIAAVGAVSLTIVTSHGRHSISLRQHTQQRSRAQLPQKSQRCINLISSRVRRARAGMHPACVFVKPMLMTVMQPCRWLRAACVAAASQDNAQQDDIDKLYMDIALEEARRVPPLSVGIYAYVKGQEGKSRMRSAQLAPSLCSASLSLCCLDLCQL